MKYLLDTNVLSETMKKRPDTSVMEKLAAADPDQMATSVVCVSELRFGAARVEHGTKLWNRIEREILSRVTLLALGEDEAIRAGDLLAELERRGTPIGVEDVWIAATALQHHLTVVTRNLRHFERIPDLKIESWW